MTMNRIKITFDMPGKLIDVNQAPDGSAKVTVELPVIDGPLLNATAREMLTRGLSDIDGDILLERISHFALTESVKSRIKVCGFATMMSQAK